MVPIPMHVFYPADENPTAPNDNTFFISGKEFVNILLSSSCEPSFFDGCNILGPSLEVLGSAWDSGCIPDISIPIKPTGSAETVTRNAAPAPGERPLIVFSHGLNLPVFMYTDLLARLASYGFVVAAPVYSDFDYAFHLKESQDPKPSICSRFREVREAIKFMTNNDIAKKYGIDHHKDKVAAMGHSLGGATTLSTVVGGSLDNLGGCKFDDGLDLDLSNPDDSVKLALTLAQTTVAGVLRAFTPEQVKKELKHPVLALSSGNDAISDPDVHVEDIFNEMKCKEKNSVRVEIEDGDHSGSFTDIYPGLDLSGVYNAIGSSGGGLCFAHTLSISALQNAWAQTLGGYRDMTPAERTITTAYPVSFLKSFLLGKNEYEENLERENAVESDVLDLDACVFVDEEVGQISETLYLVEKRKERSLSWV